jgi:pyruvate dehydrogenase (quinone)
VLPLVRQKTDDSFLRAQLGLYAHVKKHMQAYVESNGGYNTIHPEFVSAVLDQLAADDAIFTVDTGMSSVWGGHYITATGKRVMLGS